MKYLTILLLILTGIYYPLQACTGLSLRAKDGTYVQARTIEWSDSYLPSEYVIIPREQTIVNHGDVSCGLFSILPIACTGVAKK